MKVVEHNVVVKLSIMTVSRELIIGVAELCLIDCAVHFETVSELLYTSWAIIVP
jgi:hypothetical protein